MALICSFDIRCDDLKCRWLVLTFSCTSGSSLPSVCRMASFCFPPFSILLNWVFFSAMTESRDVYFCIICCSLEMASELKLALETLRLCKDLIRLEELDLLNLKCCWLFCFIWIGCR